MNTEERCTVAGLLWGVDPARTTEPLVGTLRRHNMSTEALEGVSEPPRTPGLLDQRIAEELSGALDVDLGGVVLDCWFTYQELMAAAARTRAQPGSREHVEIATHEITSEHHPQVEVLVNGTVVSELTFDVTVVLTVVIVVAVVERGCLVALSSGEVRAGARLGLNGHEMVGYQQRVYRPDAVVRLGAGVPLLASTQPPPSTPGSTPSAARAPGTVSPTTAASPSVVAAQPATPWWKDGAAAATPAQPATPGASPAIQPQPAAPRDGKGSATPAEPANWWERIGKGGS